VKKSRKRKKTIEEIKTCFRELVMPVDEEFQDQEKTGFQSQIYANFFSLYIQATYWLETSTAGLRVMFPFEAPESKFGELYDLLNRLNMLRYIGSFWLDPDKGEISLHTGIYVPGDSLNRDQFKRTLNGLVWRACTFYDLIIRQISEERTAKDRVEDFKALRLNGDDDENETVTLNESKYLH